MMKSVVIFAVAALVLCAGSALAQAGAQTAPPDAPRWRTHDQSRPRPPVVTPVPSTRGAQPPQGAVVLFDGRNLDQWTGREGQARWAVRDGYFEVVPGTGAIRTRESFGDVQLHIEWASPTPPRDSGQDRGNSGVFFMGDRYEVQILDSYGNDTYPDGQAAAIYGQFPPLFNASLPPGEWQTYDISFRRPRFSTDGRLLEPARLTVFHNGVLVQNNEQLLGSTMWLNYLPFEPHADALPIELQDHGSPVRFRNIWAVRLPERPQPDAAYASARPTVELPAATLERLAGAYNAPGSQEPMTIVHENGRLFMQMAWRPGRLELLPASPTEFHLRDTDARIVFNLNRRGVPTGLTFHIGGATRTAIRAR